MHDNILNCLKEYKKCPIIKTNRYIYKNHPVPRVTSILSKMIHEEALMNWANYLGLYKRTKLKDELSNASSIGTHSHNTIEKYIKKSIIDKEEIRKEVNNDNIYELVNNCLYSFILWWDDISGNKINVLGIEQKLICKWFGGTYDLLLSINEVNYIIDFKTSNHITYKYFLQLAAYKYMLELQGISIGGCIILQLDKNTAAFEEYYLNFENKLHSNFIEQCTRTFLSLVYGYYNILESENIYNKIFKK